MITSPDPLPYEPPRLQWSFNRDGEVKDGRIATERDRSMSFDMAGKQGASVSVDLRRLRASSLLTRRFTGIE